MKRLTNMSALKRLKVGRFGTTIVARKNAQTLCQQTESAPVDRHFNSILKGIGDSKQWSLQPF
jgi:hypothetical protein